MIAPARSRAVLALALLAAALGYVLLIGERPAVAPSDRPGDVASTAPAKDVAPDAVTAAEPPAVLSGGNEEENVRGDQARVPAAPAREPAELEVQVVALETGAPIEGVSVSLLEHVGERMVVALARYTRPTDPAGRATFELGEEKVDQVQASGWKARAGDGFAEVPALGPGEHGHISISIPTRTIPIHGLVVDAVTGDPQPDADVALGPIGRGQITWAAQTRSGAGGAFELVLPSWSRIGWRITVDHDGYATAFRELDPPGEDLELRLTVPLQHGATMVARVVDPAGAPVPEAVLGLDGDPRGGQSAVTGPDGTCRIAGLSPDLSFRVELTLRGKLVQQLEDPLRLAPGEERRLDFVLGAGSRIEGLALDEGGTPAARLPVWLVPLRADETPADERWLVAADGALALRDHTDSEGRFAFEDVAPGDWWLGPAPPDGAGRPDPERCVPLAHALHLDEGQASVRSTLELRRGAWIVGKVVLGDGSGEEAIVSARDVRGALVAVTRSGGDGSFALGPLLPGRFELEARTKDGALRSSPVTCAAGDEGVTLVLPSQAGR